MTYPQSHFYYWEISRAITPPRPDGHDTGRSGPPCKFLEGELATVKDFNQVHLFTNTKVTFLTNIMRRFSNKYYEKVSPCDFGLSVCFLTLKAAVCWD